MFFSVLFAVTSAQQCGPLGGNGVCASGECCSQWGWCGTTTEYCGTGCLPAFGKCNGVTSPSPSPSTSVTPPTPSSTPGVTTVTSFSTTSSCSTVSTTSVLSVSTTCATSTVTGAGSLPTSTSGQCGPSFGTMCNVAQKQCCSQWGWCGTTSAYCGTGCQSKYGLCTGQPAPGSSSVVTSCSTATAVTVVPGTTTCRAVTSTITTVITGSVTPSPSPSTSSTPSVTPSPSTSTSSTPSVTPSPSPSGTAFIKLPAKSTPLPAAMPSVNNNLRPVSYTNCVNPKHWALTFDDGPSTNIPALRTVLKNNNVKATFFINGKNYADLANNANDRSNLLGLFQDGHQIASHTFEHADMTTLTNAQRYTQMYNNDQAIYKVIGYSPRHVRYPYLSQNTASDAALASWGFKIISVNVDTLDWNHNAAGTTQQQQIDANKAQYVSDYNKLPSGSSVISLNHDFTTYISAWTQQFITEIKGRGYTLVTVAECINDPNPYN